jgi:hypothetical protein
VRHEGDSRSAWGAAGIVCRSRLPYTRPGIRPSYRLANVGERICERLGWVSDHNQDPASEYAENCRVLVDMLIEYLDGIDPDPESRTMTGIGRTWATTNHLSVTSTE